MSKMPNKLDKQVPLLTAEMAKRLMNDDPCRDLVRIASETCLALEAIESGDAVVVRRSEMEEIIAGMDGLVIKGFRHYADRLKRALNGEKV